MAEVNVYICNAGTLAAERLREVAVVEDFFLSRELFAAIDEGALVDLSVEKLPNGGAKASLEFRISERALNDYSRRDRSGPRGSSGDSLPF